MRYIQFKNGEQAVRAPGKAYFGAWLIDFILVLALAAVVFAVLPRTNLGLTITVAVLAWIVIGWLYGFILTGRRSLGCLLCGTRVVKLSDGGRPGFWRSGWVSFVRTVGFVVFSLIIVIGALGGSSSGNAKDNVWHVSISTR
ncbi:RDD family protein [Psychromicrobium sp. YIM B11713]|uniref:RDD family protein n=1 Tax=Psychromicrobium sp. YIM B11713 TaxID=3145233 RepID=UPI00374F6F29